MDMVEVNPFLDTANKSGILASELIQSALGKAYIEHGGETCGGTFGTDHFRTPAWGCLFGVFLGPAMSPAGDVAVFRPVWPGGLAGAVPEHRAAGWAGLLLLTMVRRTGRHELSFLMVPWQCPALRHLLALFLCPAPVRGGNHHDSRGRGGASSGL